MKYFERSNALYDCMFVFHRIALPATPMSHLTVRPSRPALGSLQWTGQGDLDTPGCIDSPGGREFWTLWVFGPEDLCSGSGTEAPGGRAPVPPRSRSESSLLVSLGVECVCVRERDFSASFVSYNSLVKYVSLPSCHCDV